MSLEHDPVFGKNVIETLSEGMYDNPLFLYREYVQNSADAIDAAVDRGVLKKEKGQIEITINADKRVITFEDNGIGIPKDSVKTMLANIGDSAKDRKIHKGFRGIGRLGGLGYCQKVRFETSFKGESIKSIFEWDARNLHEILADKDDKVHAGALIKRITSVWDEACKENEHFFKVSLINVNASSDELLDSEEVMKYLSMVAPVPFDYAKFPFVKKIEKFVEDNKLPKPHEYQLYLNGEEVRKGYKTPLEIGDGKEISILDVECRKIQLNNDCIGWYWFCISKFEGVLPKKCWQRNIRLRKSNIQIGEADCLSNHPKRGDTLWREDRGNSYFMGEVHALDENLTPNSRRDYFNQDEACSRFEKVLQKEFFELHNLYHDASKLRSAVVKVQAAQAVQNSFKQKEKSNTFYDPKDREKEKRKMDAAVEEGIKAYKTIEKIKAKIGDSTSSENTAPLAKVVEGYNPATITFPNGKTFSPIPLPWQGFVADNLTPEENRILEIVFSVLKQKLPPDEASAIREEILKRIARK